MWFALIMGEKTPRKNIIEKNSITFGTLHLEKKKTIAMAV